MSWACPAGWLNDAVNGFLAGDDPLATPALDVAGLRCLVASPRMLLALKVLAHRVGENEDVFGDRLPVAARFFVEEIFAPGRETNTDP